ncbi:MAG: electron transport complex subunit RsxC, partial [Fimbriimonadaceae bacterium]|nr:electron transport complex subunit RsxC [Alphaproteobacteria bacterium]
HAEPEVQRGDKVKKGQLIAHAKGRISAPVHAPTSGTILGLHSFPAPHASGLSWQTITLRPDGLDKRANLVGPMDPFAARPEEVSDRVADRGVVGMGGATFPSAIKLHLGDEKRLKKLVINGSECEPYLSCDDRLMREASDKIVDGARIMAHALGVIETVIAIERNKPQALAAMRSACAEVEGVSVIDVPTLYPMGSEKQLVQALTGRETPAGQLTADLGLVVHNVATAHAVHDAIRHGRPLISRIVTVSGGAIRNPQNVHAPIGTPIRALIEYCGGFSEEPAKLLVGGPMMGQPINDMNAPILKGTNGILALTRAEVRQNTPMPCIRCTSCVAVCPIGLVPLEMAAYIKKDQHNKAVDLGLMDCIGCGSCSYVCPSHIPLVQYFNFSKGHLRANQAKQRKQVLTKKLTSMRKTRKAIELQERKELLARRKAEQANKLEADAAAKASSGEQQP